MKYLTVIIFTFMGNNAMAQTVTWVNNLTVERVLSRKDGGLAFETSPISVNTQVQCNSLLVYMSPGVNGVTTEGVQSAMSVLLTALSTGKEISVSALNGNDTCWATEIWIYK